MHVKLRPLIRRAVTREGSVLMDIEGGRMMALNSVLIWVQL
jgi:hypothetical protein